MTSTSAGPAREAALKYLWMHNRSWVQTGEEGGPRIVTGGEGVKVVDSEGRTWIDVNGGYNSVNVGYGRTEIAEAAEDQMRRIAFYPVGTAIPSTIELCERLAAMTPGTLSRVFPVSGGSEANETALKIARSHAHRNGEPTRYKVISREGSYHGTTAGVLWLGSSAVYKRQDFEPAYPGMVYAPQPNPYRCPLGGTTPSDCAERCARAVEDLILFHGPETVLAFIGEPVAIPTGVAVPGDEYWPMVREICDKYGVLLIDDEVICGFGRTGRWFGIDHWDVAPDMMTMSKGISSSYLPLGATVVKTEVADLFAGKGAMAHVFTSAGHPVAAAAGLKNIEIIATEGLVENAAEVGAYFKEQLEGMMGDHPSIGEVRGRGLLMGMELVKDRETWEPFAPEDRIVDRLNESFKKNGLILRVAGPVVQIGPPLCITTSEVDEIIHALDLSLWEFEGDLGIAQYA
jgi:adenosylmethionine-8-amino-7-oxononanoate aminotransferase